MVTVEINCNVEALYNWLSTNSKTLSGGDVVFINGLCTILSKDGFQAIYHGESIKFVKHDKSSWTSVPSEFNSFTVTLTEEELNILKKW